MEMEEDRRRQGGKMKAMPRRSCYLDDMHHPDPPTPPGVKGVRKYWKRYLFYRGCKAAVSL